MVKLVLPTAVGVPVIVQVVPLVAIVRPVGRVPTLTLQVNGAVPPVNATVELYGWLSVAPGSVEVVMTSFE